MARLAMRSVDLAAALAGFFSERATVYALTEGAIDSYGTPSRRLTARSGLANIPAAVGSVKSGKTLQTQRERRSSLAQSQVWYRMHIFGPHHEITDTDIVGWRGKEWRISAVVVDPTETLSELLLEYVDPSGG